MKKLEEIIEKVKAGEITEEEALRLLEQDYEQKAKWDARMDIPFGLMEEIRGLDEDYTMQQVLSRETQSIVLTVINELPPKERKCVEMYYFDGCKQGEIAERVGISQQAVSKELAEARTMMFLIALGLVVKLPSTPLYSEREFTGKPDWIMRPLEVPLRKYKRHKRTVFPFELFKADRELLLGYLAWCFGDRKTRLPSRY